MVNPQHNPVDVAISEAQTAADTAVKLIDDALNSVQGAVDSGVPVAKATVGGVEKNADQILNDAKTQVESALHQLTTLLHVTAPTQ